MKKTKKADSDDIEIRSAVNPDTGATDIWVTRDGEIIRVKDMGDKHLVNSIRLLERRVAMAIAERATSLSNSPILVGKSIQQQTEILIPIYRVMMDELNRRLEKDKKENPPVEVIGGTGRAFNFGQ